jgi:hypothetical protein
MSIFNTQQATQWVKTRSTTVKFRKPKVGYGSSGVAIAPAGACVRKSPKGIASVRCFSNQDYFQIEAIFHMFSAITLPPLPFA